ncbi:hypothetical protein HPP92_024562 [Vanilla planifolia]|uniref:Uncharacterized protein n=1 Tax=Vanilla planifolia TaxID=51239 RepID=A0A835PJW7_VANPL|nr:hypothetical protein HPP92_024562 [Vanilla planifolia]
MSKLLLLLLLLGLSLFPPHASPSSEAGCRRTGDCGRESPEMESNSAARLLWETLSKKYITYDALRRDAVPCDHPGLPYYSCRGGGESSANPYVRGCSMITGCRGGYP